MKEESQEVVLTTSAGVDGRVTLGSAQRLLDAGGGRSLVHHPSARGFHHPRAGWTSMLAVLEGSGSFVDPDARAPQWPAATTIDEVLWRDHLPTAAARWFVVADSRGRID